MQPKKQYEHPQLFHSCLDQILNLRHPLRVLANKIDWSYFEREFGCKVEGIYPTGERYFVGWDAK